MKMFTSAGLLFLLLAVNQVLAQYQGDNPNLDQIPQYLRERASAVTDAPLSSVITIGNWDNFSLGVDFAENNIAEDPNNPKWYFTAYNTNAPHHTENGIDWAIHSANFGTSVQGDPVVAYDSIGNLYYENMYGNITGCKVLKSTNNGLSWGSAVTAIAGNDRNWLACDQTSGPYGNYIYSTMTNNSAGNFTRSIDNGATFNSTYTASPHSLPGMMVAVGPQGNVQGGAVYIVTNSGSSFASNYTFFRSNDGGATFTQRSSQQWANTVGTQVSGRNSVSNMRTRPYPMIAADNSYGAHRGNFYCVYASNFPSGNGNKSDVWCRTSTDGGATWGSAVRVNDDANTQNFQQWHPSVWCDKETGKLYVMWMDTRDTPTNDSAFIYATYSTDGGATFVANQRISNKKMKIDCPGCGGGGTPRYEGDYNGVVSNKKVSMVAWADFRNGNFQSMTGYFPDFAMAIDHDSDTLYTSSDIATFQVSIPEVKLYTDTVVLSASITPAPSAGTITFAYPSGSTITTYPASLPVNVVLTGNVPLGNYNVSFFANGPNGTPAHKRTALIKVLAGNNFTATASANPTTICQGLTSQLDVVVVGGTPPLTYLWAPAASLSNPSIANPVATPGATTTYSVTVTDNSATAATGSVQVVVNTTPAAPGPVTGDQTVCAGETVGYSIVGPVGGTTYTWSVVPPASSIIGNGTANVSIVWGSVSGEIQVLASNNCGNNPAPSVLPVVVTSQPAAPGPINGPQAVCAGDTVGYMVAVVPGATSYTWSVVPPPDSIIGNGTPNVSIIWGITSGEIHLQVGNTCGNNPTSSILPVQVTECSFTTSISANPTAICQGQSSQLNIAIVGGTPPISYSWNPSTGLSDPGIANPVATPDATTTYYVVVSDNTLYTTTDSITIFVKTPPEAPGPISGTHPVCAGDTVAYSLVEVVGGATYSWSVVPPADSIVGNGTLNVSIIWGSTSGEIQVLAGNNCGNNPIPSILPVIVNIPPAALNPIAGPDMVCIGSNATFTTAILGPPDTYTWTVPSGVSITNGQGTNTIIVAWGNTTGDVTVYAMNNCGETPIIMKSIGVKTIPESAGVITGNDTICQGASNVPYSVPSIAGATLYNWSTPAGITVTAGAGTSQVTLEYSLLAQSGNITVNGTNECGEGTESSMPVVVKNCTGIDQKGLESTVRIYPNPVSNELTLSINGKEKQLVLTITNAAGQVVHSEKLESITADYKKRMDMSGFAKGVYFVRLSNNDRSYSEKVIVQ